MKPIQSQRLIISTWTINDIEDAQKLWGDPKVMQFIDIRGGLNTQQVLQKLQQEIDRQNQYGVQYWKVQLKQSNETIGCCGLRPYDIDKSIYEIGFHIMNSHWGKGYAKEAAQTVIDYAFNELLIKKLFAGHNPSNTTSKTMLEKLKFKYIGDQFYGPTGLYHPSYELEASMWAL